MTAPRQGPVKSKAGSGRCFLIPSSTPANESSVTNLSNAVAVWGVTNLSDAVAVWDDTG